MFLEELSAQYRNMSLGDAIITGRMFGNMAELSNNGKVWNTGLFASKCFRFWPSTGVGANKCLPFRRGGPGVCTIGIFWYIFNTKSCILMHSLAPNMDTISVFIKTLCIGEMKTAGGGSRMRPKGWKSRPKAESGVGFLGRGSKPHQLGGLAVM